MRHEPPHTFQIEADDDTKLIALCKAARKALTHEGEICGGASELLAEVERSMPPPKHGPDLFWLSCGQTAHCIRREMEKMRAMAEGYNKTTYAAYKAFLPRLVAYERARDEEFRRRGGGLLKRRETASRNRCDALVSEICTTPARTPLGLSFKCSVIPSWLEAGFDITEETQLLRSIVSDQNAICRGWPLKVPQPEQDQALISLAARTNRQLNKNQVHWHDLSVLQDKQSEFGRERQPAPLDLKRDLVLAGARARRSDQAAEKNLQALADCPAVTGNGYIAKMSVLNSFARFAVQTDGGHALRRSLEQDYANLTKSQEARA